MNPIRRLPAYVINGLTVALGVGLIQFLIGTMLDAHAAQLALSGAVCTSLADVPNTVSRGRQRVIAAAALALVAASVVAWLRPYPLWLGAGISLIAFAAMMAMSWGARAAALSFVPILAIVFTMAVPPGSEPPWRLAAFNALGGALYVGWALGAATVLQRFFRHDALADALRRTAALLQTRATLLARPSDDDHAADEAAAMRDWIKEEAALAESLQTARDFIFARHDTDLARRHIAILLRAIDLRDVLLASRLDLDLIGHDPAGRWIRERLARALRDMAISLMAAADLARSHPGRMSDRMATQTDATGYRHFFDDAPLTPDDARRRLLPAMSDRLRNLSLDVIRIHALLRGESETLPLSLVQLKRFVAPEGWPLRALKAQWHLESAVLRHALRSALAMGTAYFVALALPWASHPQWLVLSVAVVLRGNLEQTLTRRNARVLGTLLGCGVVMALSGIESMRLLGVLFLVAVGVAHSFVLQRYWLTATAATVMALLQAHMVNVEACFAIGERAADTLLGALLAWVFSYVLPSWERRSLPKAVARILKELDDYAGHALQRVPADEVEQRLARRRAYDALAALGLMLQRSTFEPKAVRVPVAEAAALLDHGQRLMAHLSMVRLILARRGTELERASAESMLSAARRSLHGELAEQPAQLAHPLVQMGEALSQLPEGAPAEDILPWLQRRLDLLVRDGAAIRAAASATLAKATKSMPAASMS
jgi:uncharacterized membrane protein YccC